MHFFVSAGVGGKGITPGRQALDGFGIGFYYVDVANPQFTVLGGTQSFLRDEYGFEAYYELAITPWLHLTPDVQVIRPTQKEVVGLGPPIVRQDVDWATIVGFRLRLAL
jgi:porin